MEPFFNGQRHTSPPNTTSPPLASNTKDQAQNLVRDLVYEDLSSIIVLSFTQEVSLFDERKHSQLEKVLDPEKKDMISTVQTNPAQDLGVNSSSDLNFQVIEAFNRNSLSEARLLLGKLDQVGQNDTNRSVQETCTYKNNLGCVLFRMEEHNEALKCFEEAYTLSTKSFGKRHILPVICLNNMICSHYVLENMISVKDLKENFYVGFLLDNASASQVKKHGLLHSKLYENYAIVYSVISGYIQTTEYLQKAQNNWDKALTIKQSLLPQDDPSIAQCLILIGVTYYERMFYKEALESFEKALEIRKRAFGEQHLEVAESLAYIGKCYKAFNNLPRALKYEEEAFEMRKKLFENKQNKTHLSLAKSYQAIGQLSYKNKQDNQALEYIMKALEIMTKLYDQQNSSKMASLYEDLGLIKLSQDRFSEAFQHFQSVWEIYKRIYGKMHYTIGVCMGNISTYYLYSEDYKNAREYLHKKSKIMHGLFQVDEPYMANVYDDFSKNLNSQGLYNDSIMYSIKAFEIRQKFFGENSTFIADDHISVGIVKINSKEYHEATEHFEKAMQIFEKLPDYSYKLAIVLNRLADCFSKKDKYETAIEYCEKALEIRKKLSGEHHLETAESYEALGNLYTDKEDCKAAIIYYQKALEIFKSFRADDHSDIADIYCNIGNAYRGVGNFTEALEYYKKTLKIREKLYGARGLSVAHCYYFIGMNYDGNFKYSDAIENYKKALELFVELFGKAHAEVANVHEVIGNAYYSESNFQNAMDSYQIALEIRKELFKDENVIVANSLYNIGRVHRRETNYQTAIDFYNKALDIYRKILGEEHSEVACVYEALGNSYDSEGRTNKALKYYTKSLVIREKVLGGQHRLIAQSCYNIGLIFYSQRKFFDALKAYRKALRIYESIYDRHHSDVLDTHEVIAHVYCEIRDFDRAIYHYKIAYVIALESLGADHNFTRRIKRFLVDLSEEVGKFTVHNNSPFPK